MTKETTAYSQIAGWFTLAYLLERAEREQALALFDLLAYACDDELYKEQVRVQMFEAMGSNQRCERYGAIAKNYVQRGLYQEAIGIYEQARLCEASTITALTELAALYARVGEYDYMEVVVSELFRLFEMRRARQDQLQRMYKEVAAILEQAGKYELVKSIRDKACVLVPIL